MHSSEFPLEMRVLDVMTWLEHHAPEEEWQITQNMSREDEIRGMQAFFMGLPAQWMEMGLRLQQADELVRCSLHLNAVALNIHYGELMPSGEEEMERWEDSLAAMAKLKHGGEHMRTFPQVVMSLMHHAREDGHDDVAILIALRRVWQGLHKLAGTKQLAQLQASL